MTNATEARMDVRMSVCVCVYVTETEGPMWTEHAHALWARAD